MGKVLRTCLQCGKEFFGEARRVQKGQAKFCSRECVRIAHPPPKTRLVRKPILAFAIDADQMRSLRRIAEADKVSLAEAARTVLAWGFESCEQG